MMTMESIHATFNEKPSLYWYVTKSNVMGEYMTLYKKGKHFVGYLNKPDEDTIYDMDLLYVAYGDFDWFDTFIQSGAGELVYDS